MITFLTRTRPWLTSLSTALIVSLLLPHVASASVGAGAGLPYEGTFAKIVTSLTGPWAWTVSVVFVAIYAYNAIARGGDLGGATLGFLGPAFLCTLLLGVKKLMSFFGQGAMLTEQPSLLAIAMIFGCGLAVGALMIGWIVLPVYCRSQRLLQNASLSQAAAHQEQPSQQAQPAGLTLIFTPRRIGKTSAWRAHSATPAADTELREKTWREN